MQVFLAILIAVTQVAGAWMCCCGPALIANSFSTNSAHKIPIKPSVAHCPHCSPPIPEGDKQQKTPPRPASVPVERCPCGGVELVAVPPTVDVVPLKFDQLVRVVLLYVDFDVIELVARVDPVGLRDLPFLTTTERLYAHHVLRC